MARVKEPTGTSSLNDKKLAGSASGEASPGFIFSTAMSMIGSSRAFSTFAVVPSANITEYSAFSSSTTCLLVTM